MIFDLFSSLGHSYFLMILRIQHISFVFNSFFFGEISKVLEIDSREESLFEEILCEKQRHLTGDFGTITSCGLDLEIGQENFDDFISQKNLNGKTSCDHLLFLIVNINSSR